MSAEDLVKYLGLFDEKAVVIGYPSADSRALHRVQVFDAVGITSKSQHKDGAWEFLEYFLSARTGKSSYGFSTNKDALEQELEETEIYSEATFTFRPLSQEEKEQIRGAVAAADFNTAARHIRHERVLEMIQEEMAEYLSSHKPLEEVSAVIQNRVELFLQEEI